VVAERTIREQIAELRESPPCLWEDEFRRRIPKMFPFEDLIITLPTYGHFRFAPFSDILSYASRIEAVNQYFRAKAGQVFENAKALEILSELRSKQVIPRDEWGQFDINQNAVALAMLSAAGFCEVDDYSISITNEGKQFIDGILE